MVGIGEDAPQSGGIDKRTLLIGAAIIGGGIGVFMLISRRSQPSDSAENKAQTTVPQNTLTLAYQNLAEQLLGFRGDVSVANANLEQQQQDLLSMIGAESASRLTSDQRMQASIWQVFYKQTYPNATWDDLVKNNPYLKGLDVSANSESDTTSANGASVSPAQQNTNPGAGGATPRDAILAAFGVEDDSGYYLAHMSAGPVRHISQRGY